MKRKFILLLISTCPFLVFSQKAENKCRIPLDFPGVAFDSFEINHTYVFSHGIFTNDLGLTKEDTLKITMTDCFGSCKIIANNKNQQIILTGMYCGTGDIKKTYVNVFNNEGTLIGKKDLFWYEPQKCGKWIFYNFFGKKEEEETY